MPHCVPKTSRSFIGLLLEFMKLAAHKLDLSNDLETYATTRTQKTPKSAYWRKIAEVFAGVYAFLCECLQNDLRLQLNWIRIPAREDSFNVIHSYILSYKHASRHVPILVFRIEANLEMRKYVIHLYDVFNWVTDLKGRNRTTPLVIPDIPTDEANDLQGQEPADYYRPALAQLKAIKQGVSNRLETLSQTWAPNPVEWKGHVTFVVPEDAWRTKVPIPNGASSIMIDSGDIQAMASIALEGPEQFKAMLTDPPVTEHAAAIATLAPPPKPEERQKIATHTPAPPPKPHDIRTAKLMEYATQSAEAPLRLDSALAQLEADLDATGPIVTKDVQKDLRGLVKAQKLVAVGNSKTHYSGWALPQHEKAAQMFLKTEERQTMAAAARYVSHVAKTMKCPLNPNLFTRLKQFGYYGFFNLNAETIESIKAGVATREPANPVAAKDVIFVNAPFVDIAI